MQLTPSTSFTDVDILLVEDNHDEAELTIRSLRKIDSHSKLVHIDDGAEALDFIFARNKYSERKVEHSPRMILLDLKLPKVDGLEVLKSIKADPRTRTIPVVMLTSSKEQNDVVESYNYGVNSYIVKPVNFERFVDAVQQLGVYWLLLNQPPKLEV